MQVNSAKQMQAALEDGGKTLVPLLGGNLVDQLWGSERPGPPTAPLRIHSLDRAGEAAAQKISRLRRQIQGMTSCLNYF